MNKIQSFHFSDKSNAENQCTNYSFVDPPNEILKDFSFFDRFDNSCFDCVFNHDFLIHQVKVGKFRIELSTFCPLCVFVFLKYRIFWKRRVLANSQPEDFLICCVKFHNIWFLFPCLVFVRNKSVIFLIWRIYYIRKKIFVKFFDTFLSWNSFSFFYNINVKHGDDQKSDMKPDVSQRSFI